MRKKFILAAALLALLAACAPARPYATLEQLSVFEARLATLESNAASSSVADLEARLAALEAQVAVLEAMPAADPHAEAGVFELAVAQYVMDTAGFHGMEEALSETGVVDPAFLSAVTRVAKVVAATTWPEDLHPQVEAFEGLLTGFAAALEADDAVTATSLAAEVHEAQHDLSHTIDGILGGANDEHMHDEGG